MKTTVYDFNDYKKYLLEMEASKVIATKGFRSKLAAALSCQPAFITLVLNGSHDLSVEQAFTANQFLQHTEEESNFFLLLVQYARAGVRGLSQHYRKQMDQIREERKRLNARLKIDNKLSEEERALYYSSWHYSALHVVLTCPQWRTREAISERLQLSPDRTEQLLNDLVRMGLAQKEGPRYLPSTTRLHLDDAPLLVNQHHANWRIRSIESLSEKDALFKPLHFSAAVSLTLNDLDRVRDEALKFLEALTKIVSPSKEEEIAAITLDLFRL